MTDTITKLQSDEPIQNMARDLAQSPTPWGELVDANDVPLMHYALEARAEYHEERGGHIAATASDIAQAVVQLARGE